MFKKIITVTMAIIVSLSVVVPAYCNTIETPELDAMIEELQAEDLPVNELIKLKRATIREAYKALYEQEKRETTDAAAEMNEASAEEITKETTATTETYTEQETGMTYAGDWTITFYDDCPECVGQYAGMNTTASGATPTPWYTVAAGPSYPFGTRLYIEGFGEFIVQDRGVGDGWADIFVRNHSEIPSYGMTTACVYIIN